MVFNESRYDNKIIPKDNLSFCQNEGCENRIIREKRWTGLGKTQGKSFWEIRNDRIKGVVLFEM